MKNKILIITLFGNYNIGNKLQNYALEKVITEMGFDVKTANISYDYDTLIMQIKKYIKNTLMYLTQNKYVKNRNKKFKDFTNKYLHCTKKKISTRGCQIKGFDYFIYGSDQIWNPSCFGTSDLFLGFRGEKSKNIVYAASFGVAELPESLRRRYTLGFENFTAISVRENEGIHLLPQNIISSVNPKVVLDPTLLLDENEWGNLAEQSPEIKGNYILFYCLGEKSESLVEWVENLAVKNGYTIIDVLDDRDPNKIIGPIEFLQLVRGAKLVITDSYHACVFSFIFETPFVVYYRKGVENMNSRIDTLLQTFKMKNRLYVDNISNITIEQNFSEGKEILKGLRKESFIYLKSNIKGEC